MRLVGVASLRVNEPSQMMEHQWTALCWSNIVVVLDPYDRREGKESLKRKLLDSVLDFQRVPDLVPLNRSHVHHTWLRDQTFLRENSRPDTGPYAHMHDDEAFEMPRR